jgi:hypothetical protein
MRTAIIIGRKHGQKSLVLVSGPEVPIVEQKELFKDFQRDSVHDDFEYVELWTSDAGCVKDRKLISPKVAAAKAKAEAEAKAKAEAEAKAKQKAEAKAKADADAKAKAEAETSKTKSDSNEN